MKCDAFSNRWIAGRRAGARSGGPRGPVGVALSGACAGRGLAVAAAVVVGWIVLATGLGVGVTAQSVRGSVEARPAASGRVHTMSVATSASLARQLAVSVDAGDVYASPAGRRYLRRLPGAVAVKSGRGRDGDWRALTRTAGPLEGFAESKRLRSGWSILTAPADRVPRESGPDVALLRQVRRTRPAAQANPVFVDPRTGFQLLIDGRFIVRLAPDTDAARHFGAQWKNVRPLWGTADQFVVSLPGATAEEILGEVNRQAGLPGVVWAEPDFISQAIRSAIPNDPDFSQQWHLRNTGQTGARSGADARLPGAWDVTIGRSNIVIAILDDGVQLTHPDLGPNLFRNTGEIEGNGFDDDRNGVVDDVHGYNFVVDLPDANPYSDEDNHGTSVAGVAAAVGNNGTGVAGVAYGCRILPVKVLEGEFAASTSDFAKALRYAAGLNASGQSVWRGADVVNISLAFSQQLTTDAALGDVVNKGRQGRGCAVFVAAGNYASAWEPVEYTVPEAGTYTLRFEYSKDKSDLLSTGADTVWIDSIRFPDGSTETFENGLPQGFATSEFSRWTIVTEGVGGNEALTGWNGPGSKSLRAGRITHGQTNYAEITRDLTPGRLVFWALVSSEIDYDYFDFWVGHNGTDTLIFSQSGVPIPELQVGYPASNPNTIAVGASTDFDYRADYSQYGALLDFVAPSDGGLATITTTDRTGPAGYSGTDYTGDFGGTSASTPLAAGVAALALSANPYIKAGEIRSLLRGTCDRIGGVSYDANGRNAFYGSGRINAARALSQVYPNLRVTLDVPAGPVTAGDLMTYSIAVRNIGFNRSGLVTVTNPLPDGTVFVSSNPTAVSRTGGRLTFVGGTLAAGGTWTINVTVSNTLAGSRALLAGATNDVPEISLADNAASGSFAVLPVPTISVLDVSVPEGNAGRSNAAVTVTLSNPSSRTVTVTGVTATNSAAAGRDFVASKSVVTFAPGQTNKTLMVPIVGDLLNEADETFLVRLQSPVNAVLGDDTATVTILDDDPLPVIAGADVVRPEGNAGAAKAVFKFSLSAPSGRAASFSFATSSGTAQAGTDFVPTNGVAVFPAGKTTATVTVLVAGDKTLEMNESFFLNLSQPVNAVLATNTLVGTILNNDPPPKLFADDAGAVEGNGPGTNFAMVRIRLVPASALPVMVGFTTTNGTAVAGADYLPANGVVSFAPGETNQFVAIGLVGDSLVEPLETFSLRLSDSFNAAIGRAVAKVSITNDDLNLSFGAGAELVTGVASLGITLRPRWDEGRLMLRFSSVPGQVYVLESCGELGGTWQVVDLPEVTATGNWTEVPIRPDPTEPQRFYRVRTR